MAFTVRMTDAELAEVDAAALTAGVSRARYVARDALAAARQLSGDTVQLARQVAEMHAVVCGGLSGERGAAVAGLVVLGWTEARAKKRVAALADATADELIAQAMKENRT